MCISDCYRCDHILGTGGMGWLYLATDVESGNPVAVKMLPKRLEGDSGMVARFELEAKAGLLLNLVNDGWYDRTPAARLHLQLARWRALESGAPLVRVASTGISAHVDPRGRLVQALPVGEAGVLAGGVPISTRVTPFERFGYLPLYLAALALAVSVLLVPER